MSEEVKSVDVERKVGEGKSEDRRAPEAATPRPELPMQAQPTAQTWSPSTEHDQTTIAHAAVLQGHVNALVGAVQAGAPESIKKIHTDAIAQIAATLSEHVNEKAESDKVVKNATTVAAAKKVQTASKTDWTWVVLAVGGALLAALVAAQHYGLIH